MFTKSSGTSYKKYGSFHKLYICTFMLHQRWCAVFLGEKVRTRFIVSFGRECRDTKLYLYFTAKSCPRNSIIKFENFLQETNWEIYRTLCPIFTKLFHFKNLLSCFIFLITVHRAQSTSTCQKIWTKLDCIKSRYGRRYCHIMKN